MPLSVRHELTDSTASELRNIHQIQARCLRCGQRGTKTTIISTGASFFRCGPVPEESAARPHQGCGSIDCWS